jgi:hypothetical protein
MKHVLRNENGEAKNYVIPGLKHQDKGIISKKNGTISKYQDTKTLSTQTFSLSLLKMKI